MSNQEQFDEEEDGPASLSICIQEALGAELGLQKLEEVMNTKAASYTTKIESLIQVWQQVRKCHLDIHGEYVVRLMDWLKRHTLNIVLNGDWKAKKNITGQYEEKLLDEINNCELYLSNANNIYSLRCRKLAEVIKDPWGNANLIRILSGSDITVGPEVFEFFRMETGHLLSTRLKQLCESHCEDLALNLLTVFMECHRLSEVENFSLNASLNQIRYCYDVYIALLFKFKRYDDIITTLRSMSLVEGLELITRFAKKRVSALKIWKHSKQIAHLVGTEYVREIVAKSPDKSVETLEAFLEIWLSVTNISNERLVKLFKDNIRRIILTAESAILLYPFCEVVFKKFGKEMKTFVIELYIRALTTDMNIMEREKNENETEKMTATAERLSNGFLRLADVLDEHVKVSRECALTSFSLVPTRTSFNKIIALAVRSGCESIDSWKCKYHPPADLSGSELSPCKECGEYISEVKKTPVNINTALSEALTAEEIGLAPQLCDDLVVLLSCPRYQFLNWLVPWRDLYRLCVIYLDDAEGTRNFVKDLKFVEIDYSLLPPINRDLEENDGPIYEPYLADYLNWEEPVSDTQDIHSNIDTEIPLLQPYCSKSNPEVIKTLRQFRRTSKRPKSPTLENGPPEKVFLPSSSAPSASSTCSDSWSDCSDKTSDFFVPFYYYVNNYHKRSKLIPYKKKHKTPSSTSVFPNSNISLNDFPPEKNLDNCAALNYSIVSQTMDLSTPLDYSVQSQTMTYSQPIEKNTKELQQNSNNSNSNSSFSNEIQQLVNNSKLLIVSESVTNDTVSNVSSGTYKETSSISSNTFLDSSLLPKNYDSCIESINKCNSAVKENLAKGDIIKHEHSCYVDEMNCSDLNSIIDNSDSESIHSDLEIIESGTAIKKSCNFLHRKSKFYRETPLNQDVELDYKKQNTDTKFGNSQSIVLETEQNFHMEGKNTDSPEDEILVNIEKLDAESLKTVVDSEEPEIITNGNSFENKIAILNTENNEYLNFSENVLTFLRTKNISEISELGEILESTIKCMSKCNKRLLKVTKQNSTCTSSLGTDTVESKVSDCSYMVLMVLEHVCDHCKKKLKLLEKTSITTVDSGAGKMFFSIALNCIKRGHSNINIQRRSMLSMCSGSFQNSNVTIDDVNCADYFWEISKSGSQYSQLNTSENNEEDIPLNLSKETEQPLNLTNKSVAVAEAENCATLLDFANYHKLNIKIEDTDESCDIPKNVIVVSASKSLPNCESKSYEKFHSTNCNKMVHSRLPVVETTKEPKKTSLHVNNVSDFENLNNLPPRQLAVACDSSNTPRPKKKKLTDLKKKYNLRHASVVLHRVNERKACKRKINYLQDTCLSCSGPNKKHELNTKINKSENKIKEKIEIESKHFIIKSAAVVPKHNKTSPLQDINPKVFSKSRDLKKCSSTIKQKFDTRVPYVILNRLEVDQNKEDNTNSPFSNVPGLHDLQMIKPSSVDRIVQVVQVPGGRCVTNVPVQANMTQISPHIQRIGQPRFEKLECTNNSATTTDSAASTTPTLMNIIPQQTSRPTNNARLRRNLPAINLVSQTMKPANSTTTCTFQVASSGNTSESQVNNVPRVITSGEQILNQLINPDGTSTQALRTLVGSTGSDQNRIVQLICKASDGKLIPVTSFTSNKVVKLSMTQTVNSQVTGNATGSEENVTKFSQTTTKIKAELMENSEILPKFQQAFGKPAYQNCVNVTECITVNNSERDASSDVGKSNAIRTQPKNANASINVQPVQGGVIYARQVPVAQSINIIPPARGQILRIATSSTEELSLVKETVIQGKMTALLAAALQGNKQKSLNSNGVSMNSEEYSQMSTHVALTACPALVQNARIVKPIIQIPSNMIRNSPQCNLSSTTLEQLREFDMVYKQVKERSNTGAITDTNAQSDSNEEMQHVSVTYLNQGQKINCAPVVVVSNCCNVQPASSPSLSITSQGSSSPCVTPAPTPITSKVAVKAKARIIKNPIAQVTKTSPISKPQQKPQEDEHTTQRIFDILAEYAEQLRNSPDLNNKPAPRRRSNPPTNPNQNCKRKKSTGSKKLEQSNSTVDIDIEDAHTIGSEDSSCGVIQLSVPDDEQLSVELNENSLIPKQIILTDNVTNQHHNLIITDSTVGEALKVSGTAVLVPGNYIMPISMMKGSQQIVVSGGSKILATVPARSGSNMLLFQSFINQAHNPILSTVKCSTVQPVIDVRQNLSPSSNQPSIDVPITSQSTSVTLTHAATRTSALMDTYSDREVFLNIPEPLENMKASNEQIRRVYHNNFYNKKIDAKEESPYLERVNNDSISDSSTVLQENAATSTGTTDNRAIVINSLASTTNSISEINSSVTTVNTSVATSVITHIKDEMNGLKGAEKKSEITRQIFDSGDFIKDTEVQMEGRLRSVLVATGTTNGFSFPHIASTICNKQADSTISISHFNKDICDEGKFKNKKPVVHTYRGRTKKIRKGSRLSSNKNVPIQLVPHKDLQRKQVIIQKDLHLQKSLSEECEDLGVDEPSTTELFPEADFMYDSTNQFEQSSLPVVRKVSQPGESTDEPKEVGLFCDIEPVRTDSFFDSFECQTEILQFRFEGLSNGHYTSDAAVDNTLLQTSLSADEVTIPDPREGNTSPSSIYKYECIYTNCKKNERETKVKEKLSAAARRNSSDKSSIVLEAAKSAKIGSTNQSFERCEHL